MSVLIPKLRLNHAHELSIVPALMETCVVVVDGLHTLTGRITMAADKKHIEIVVLQDIDISVPEYGSDL